MIDLITPIVCSVCLVAVIGATIFSGSFRRDILGGQGKAKVLGIMSVEGVTVCVLSGLFLGGLVYSTRPMTIGVRSAHEIFSAGIALGWAKVTPHRDFAILSLQRARIHAEQAGIFSSDAIGRIDGALAAYQGEGPILDASLRVQYVTERLQGELASFDRATIAAPAASSADGK